MSGNKSTINLFKLLGSIELKAKELLSFLDDVKDDPIDYEFIFRRENILTYALNMYRNYSNPDPEIIKIILENGAKIDAINVYKENGLLSICKYVDDIKVFKLIFDYIKKQPKYIQEKILLQLDKNDNNALTIIYFNYNNNYANKISFLFNNGLYEKKYIQHENISGNTLLILACEKGDDISIIKKIFINSNMNHRNKYGDTALHSLCKNYLLTKNNNNKNIYSIVKFLIQEGIDVEKTNKKMYNPIMLACYNNFDLRIIKLLIDNTSDEHFIENKNVFDEDLLDIINHNDQMSDSNKLQIYDYLEKKFNITIDLINKPIYKWEVSFVFEFIRTFDNNNTDYGDEYYEILEKINKEKNPSNKILFEYLSENNRYIDYLESLYAYGDYGKLPEIIEFTKENKIIYLLETHRKSINYDLLFKSKKDVKTYLTNQSLADGIWEGCPGSCGVYPSKIDYTFELGVIKFKNIKVEKKKIS
jgi:ankyrin repeat protein